MGAIPLFFCSVSCEIVGKTSKYRRFRVRAVEFRVFSLSSVVLPYLHTKAAQTRFLENKRKSACVFPCWVRKRRNKHDGTRLLRPKKTIWLDRYCLVSSCSFPNISRSICLKASYTSVLSFVLARNFDCLSSFEFAQAAHFIAQLVTLLPQFLNVHVVDAVGSGGDSHENDYAPRSGCETQHPCKCEGCQNQNLLLVHLFIGSVGSRLLRPFPFTRSSSR